MAGLIPNFGGDIVTPTDPSYPSAIARWATNTVRRAKVVTFPKDQNDVTIAIAYARSHNLPLAIKGGGHNAAGASSVEDGLVIDLSRYFNRVRVDPESKRAYVGGGSIWETVDKEAIKHGLATVGGTVNHTGVGGLTLGGGYGYLSGEHGMVIDNLLEATVITASGIAHTASATVNPDLFFGIRGGGSNFGVVTEFVYQLHPQRATIFAGLLFYPQTSQKALVDLTQEWYEKMGEKEAILQVMTVGPDGNPVIVAVLFYNGSEEEGKANFKAFYDVPHLPLPDSPQTPIPRERPYEELNALLNHIAVGGKAAYWKGIGLKSPRYPAVSKAFQHFIDATSASKPEITGNIVLEYFSLSKICSVPNGTTAFLRHPTLNMVVAFNWKHDPETDKNTAAAAVERARTLAYELCDIIGSSENQGDGVTDVQKLGYANYEPAPAELDKAKAMFDVNYQRLQGIKKRYDPENIFNRWFPITPA